MLLLVVLGAVAGGSIWLTLDAGNTPTAVPHAELHLETAAVDRAAPAVKVAPSLAAEREPAEPAAATQPAPAASAAEPVPEPVAASAPPEPEPAAKPEPAIKPEHAAAAAAPSTEQAPAAAPATESAPPRSQVATRPPQELRRPERSVPTVRVETLPPGMTLPRVATGPPLSIAPDPGLVQKGEFGLLPVIGADGRKPWRVYARPFDHTDRRPRVAIVITGLGHSGAETETAVQGLPGAVTLAFSPYSRRLDEFVEFARAAGHEVLINVPMEPTNYPKDDPGPQTLLTSLDDAANARRLMWALGRVTGYVGVLDYWGSRFTASGQHMRPVLTALNTRGLLFLDSHTSTRSTSGEIAAAIGLPWAENSHFIDRQKSRDEIDARLRELETIARQKGHAVGIGWPYPVTLERVAAWASGADRRGIVLAPVSAVVGGERSG